MMTYAKAIAVALVVVAVYAAGVWVGYDKANDRRKAEVAALTAGYAEAYAKAEKQAREHLEEETQRANLLAVQLMGAKRQIAAQTQDITRRIRHAAQAGAAGCRFGPDFVRLYNEALGYPGGGALPEDASAAGTDHAGGPAPAAGPGLLPDRPVTPEDLLAHARDYGAWARGMRAQLAALGELLKEGL
ncbi:MAG: hypothetical protein FD177_85 [Desulfovibrionaceae bacterium]|nr:MAG: hypothetical protein FD177_85 [Desulfovibrionaceae bacterium]